MGIKSKKNKRKSKQKRNLRNAIITAILIPLIGVIVVPLIGDFFENRHKKGMQENQNVNLTEVHLNDHSQININQTGTHESVKDTVPLKFLDLNEKNPSVKNIKIDSLSNLNFEILDSCNTQYNHQLLFQLSNPYGSGLIVVDSIIVNIEETKPFKITDFPDGPWAVIHKRVYKVNLNPSVQSYLVNSEFLSFKPYETENIVVEMSSDTSIAYIIKMIINYYNPADSKNKKSIVSGPYKIPFPEYENIRLILKKAKSIDFCLNCRPSIDALFALLSFEYPEICKTRYIFSDSFIRTGTGEDYGYGNAFLTPNFNLVPDSIYKRVTFTKESLYSDHYQSMLIDDSILVSYISYGKGQIFTKKEIVQNHAKKFNEAYTKNYFAKESQINILCENMHFSKYFFGEYYSQDSMIYYSRNDSSKFYIYPIR